MPTQDAEFDVFAEDYGKLVDQSIKISGESSQYFANARIECLRRMLDQYKISARKVLDFGCGIGLAAPLLLRGLGAHHVHGVDVSSRSIDVARRNNTGPQFGFSNLREFVPDGSYDVVYCSGVFHHIPLGERRAAIECVFRSLRPGGHFALWEHNPSNLGTRWAVASCVFDVGVILLRPIDAERLLKGGGLEILSTRHHFIFPKSLSRLRWTEQWFVRLPIGAQYQVLGRKRLTQK
ncbi:MAG: class I SAM-dependent methyltransferase [Burkholderiales bacterium]|nr:class I SAM-dependent methyltransferase [Phycisphaerae bacterium]